MICYHALVAVGLAQACGQRTARQLTMSPVSMVHGQTFFFYLVVPDHHLAFAQRCCLAARAPTPMSLVNPAMYCIILHASIQPGTSKGPTAPMVGCSRGWVTKAPMAPQPPAEGAAVGGHPLHLGPPRLGPYTAARLETHSVGTPQRYLQMEVIRE